MRHVMIETLFQPALNKRAEDIYSWVNVIVKKDWSFDTVNDEDVRGIIKLSSVCEKTLKTYMHGIGKKVTTSIKNILSDKRFCIVSVELNWCSVSVDRGYYLKIWK